MKTVIRRTLYIMLALCIVCTSLTLSACGTSGDDKDRYGIIHDTESGGVYIKLTIDEFNELGFKYGDSVDVEFSNGYKLEGLPYYNGYYVKSGEPLLIAYPDNEYIKAAVNIGDDLWYTAELNENMTAKITLVSHGTYLATQEARELNFTDDRKKYSTDEAYANFRSVSVSCIKPNTLYRSASPCNTGYKRSAYADTLMSKASVTYILNLSDKSKHVNDYIASSDFNSPYYKSLFDAGMISELSLNNDYGSDQVKLKLAQGLTVMSRSEGPYLVHCTDGDERTGFVCMLLEALVGATYEEIEADFMITYDNYCGVTAQSDPDKYNTIVSDVLAPMVQIVAGDKAADVKSADLSAGAEKYLLTAGMSQRAINQLKDRLAAK